MLHLKLKEDQREEGFTLIELLVVVVIIGILAAIAIPSFLSQREGAWDSAAQSDLRNAATAQESFYGAHSQYFNGTEVDGEDLSNYGFNEGAEINFSVESANSEGFCMDADHDSSGTNFFFDSAEGAPLEGACSDDGVGGYTSE